MVYTYIKIYTYTHNIENIYDNHLPSFPRKSRPAAQPHLVIPSLGNGAKLDILETPKTTSGFPTKQNHHVQEIWMGFSLTIETPFWGLIVCRSLI